MMLQLDSLSVTYGGTLEALRDVTLTLPDRGVVALLGSNGAGKTTLLRAISRTLRRHRGKLTGGRVLFDGDDLTRTSPSDVVAHGIVQVPEGRRIFGRLTVEENLRVGGIRRRDRRAAARTRDHVFELFPVLADRRHQRGLLLSGGEQQMLAIGRAMMASPKVLMLDEPSLGLAPKIVHRIGEVITQLNKDGMSILLIEQNANMALSVADYAYVLENGQVSLSGSSADLAATDDIRHLYLGHSTGDDQAPDDESAAKTLTRWDGIRR